MAQSLVLLPTVVWLSSGKLEDPRQKPALLDMYTHELKHKAHLLHCLSYQEYGFHLELCVPTQCIQVQERGLRREEGRGGSSAGLKCLEATGWRAFLSLMAGDSFNWGWGTVCTAQFWPH